MNRYTADDVGAIVADAARRQYAHDDTFTEDDIADIASEFGVNAEFVDQAIADRRAVAEAERRREREMRSFRTHATVYALVIGSMWIVGLVGLVVAVATETWGAIPFWVVFPTFGWGIGLWSHWRKVDAIGTDREMRYHRREPRDRAKSRCR